VSEVTKKSRRLVLPGDDYDNELVRDQMRVKDVHGNGGYRRNAIIDPGKIIGSSPMIICRAVTKEHKEAFTA